MKNILIKLLWIAIPVLLYQSVLATEYGDKERTLSISKGGNLNVSINSGNIFITTWSKNEVNIKLNGDDLSNLKISQDGNTISIRSDERESSYRNKSVTLLISIPNEFNIDLKTSGGNIKIENNLKGNGKINTAGGNITIQDNDGKISMKTSGGNISVGNVNGNVEATTSGGEIKCGNITGSAMLSTAGGNIKMGNVNNSVTAKTSGGNIFFNNISGKAELKTAGGNIEGESFNNGTIELKTSGGDIRLNSGNGKVAAKTAAGDIDLRNIKGSVAAKTSAGEIWVELTPAANSESELTTSAGDIQLFIPGNTNTKIDAVVHMQGMWIDDDDNDFEGIISDFKAVSFEKKKNTQKINATYILNNGGSTINLKAVMGKISIKKMK